MSKNGSLQLVARSTNKGAFLKVGGVMGSKLGMVARKVGALLVVKVCEDAGPGINLKASEAININYRSFLTT